MPSNMYANMLTFDICRLAGLSTRAFIDFPFTGRLPSSATLRSTVVTVCFPNRRPMFVSLPPTPGLVKWSPSQLLRSHIKSGASLVVVRSSKSCYCYAYLKNIRLPSHIAVRLQDILRFRDSHHTASI